MMLSSDEFAVSSAFVGPGVGPLNSGSSRTMGPADQPPSSGLSSSGIRSAVLQESRLPSNSSEKSTSLLRRLFAFLAMADGLRAYFAPLRRVKLRAT
eukprot:CAMPEP_0113254786 /NCGR_PEP_ID=MMETSP0008_2-20120614/13890_1 /TAXON_ID=97485 /ORGANISM="Prymnesium parvum" /LENGTH=96 /DNA_ID=CAMNT_0000103033 /DNA_START=988 /DNA_END=1278 /DNA_ORIENTATION=+ /assembly_acc=CAM_ASM_000153